MKIAPIFCCLIALALQSLAQTPDPASTAGAAKPLSRSQLMNVRRAQLMIPAPRYKGPAAKAARRDGRRFRLPKDLLLKLRAGEIGPNSDYFKPTATGTSDTTLLTDSAYVKTYRYYAFNNAQRQMIHPVGTGLLIGGSAFVAAALTVAIIIALAHSKG